MRRGASEPGLSLVMPVRAAGRCSLPSTFSENCHGRFRDSDLLRRLLKTTVERCMAEWLVGDEGLAVYARLIGADTNHQTRSPGSACRTPDDILIPFASISPPSTAPHSMRPRRSCQSIRCRQIRRPAEPACMAAKPITPTGPTTS